MFKKYKIRKEKEKPSFSIKAKKINVKESIIEKPEIYKIKTMLYNKNKKNAFKRILALKQYVFDENIYFLSINIMSEALNSSDALVLSCIKKILNSEKFFTIEENMLKYLILLKTEPSIFNFFLQKRKGFLTRNNKLLELDLKIEIPKVEFNKPIYLLR